MANNNVIVSRIQNRRGLKQDLPQPLRAGEIGFASDSNQIYIGADLDNSATESTKKLIVEKTAGAKDTIKSIANNQIIAFTIPHIRFENSGLFDGITKTANWFSSTSSTYTLPSGSDTRNVFQSNVTTGNITSIETTLTFSASDISVYKNGLKLTGNNTATISTLTDQDYIFSSNSNASIQHTLTFRNAPLDTDAISINYYSNTAVIRALDGDTSNDNDSNIRPNDNSVSNFYSSESIPEYRQISPKFIRISPTTGVGYIGLQHKQISVNADSYIDIPSANISNLGNLLVSRDSDAVSGTYTGSGNVVTVAYADTSGRYNTSSYHNYVYASGTGNSNIDDNVFAVASANTTHITFDVGSSVPASGNISHTRVRSFDLSGQTTLDGIIAKVSSFSDDDAWQTVKSLPQYNADGSAKTSQRLYVSHKPSYASVGIDFKLHENNSTLANLNLVVGSYTKNTASVKAKLERFLHNMVSSNSINVFESVSAGEIYSTSSNASIENFALNFNTEETELSFTSKEEARDFSYLLNNLYYEYGFYNDGTSSGVGLSQDKRGLTTINTNIELLTSTAAASTSTPISFEDPSTATVANGTSNVVSKSTNDYENYAIEYIVDSANSTANYRRVGTMYMSAFNNSVTGNTGVAFTDIASDIGDNVTGNVTFSATLSASNAIVISATSTVGSSATMSYIERRWKSPIT